MCQFLNQFSVTHSQVIWTNERMIQSNGPITTKNHLIQMIMFSHSKPDAWFQWFLRWFQFQFDILKANVLPSKKVADNKPLFDMLSCHKLQTKLSFFSLLIHLVFLFYKPKLRTSNWTTQKLVVWSKSCLAKSYLVPKLFGQKLKLAISVSTSHIHHPLIGVI